MATTMTTRTTNSRTLGQGWVPLGTTIVHGPHVYPFGLTGAEYWRRRWAVVDCWDRLDRRQRRRERLAFEIDAQLLDLGGEG